MAEVEDAKAAGNAAFKAGDNEEAVRCYTEAIRDDPTNQVLFSNRSASYAKLGQFKDALLDANKCIDLKPDWAKGHSRRGAAYLGLKSFRAALGAFEKGLEIEPTNAYMLDESARLRKLLEGGNAPPAGSSNATPPPAPSKVTSSGRLHGFLSLNILIFTTFYTLPFFPSRALTCYKMALGFSMALFLNTLASTWPISLATLKDPKFLQSTEIQALLLCLMMLVSPPLPFGIMPFVASATLNVCRCYMNTIKMLPGFVGRAVVPRAEFLLTEEGSQMAAAFAAVSEVIVAVMSPLVIVLQGFRVAVLCFIYFRYVARKHASDYWTQQAVSALTDKLRGIFYHKWAPAIFGVAFERIKGLVATVAAKVA